MGYDIPEDHRGPTSADVYAVVAKDSRIRYLDRIVSRAFAAQEKAQTKFPQPNYVILKVAEEAGEVVRAAVHYAEGRMSWQELEDEAVQLIAMTLRLLTEGDRVNGVIPPSTEQ